MKTREIPCPSCKAMFWTQRSRDNHIEEVHSGLVGEVVGIEVAVEHNGDGSVTLAPEIVDEIMSDEHTPGWIRKLLERHPA